MNIELEIKDIKHDLNYAKKCEYDHVTLDVYKVQALLTAYEKEKEKNNNAYIKANNYLYFNDSTDYEVALWEVIRKLRPDLAEKWDNGEDAVLEYIEEE